MNKNSLGMLVFTILLSACVPLKSSGPPPTIYALHPAQQKSQSAGIAYVISIPEPEVPAGFDTSRIALYLFGGRRLDYYANISWPERLGKVLQEVMVQSASTLPDGLAVVPDTGIPAAYDLRITINDFQPVYVEGPENIPLLKISMSFRLVSLHSRKIIFDTTLSLKKSATANTQTEIISGLESLLHQTITAAFKEMAPKIKMDQKSLSSVESGDINKENSHENAQLRTTETDERTAGELSPRECPEGGHPGLGEYPERAC